jgi:2-polyprenyl-3-methyl-5-hydroxy-6-metoxy-1,4-benzoquinol methylase
MKSFFQNSYRRLVDSPNNAPFWWHSMPLPDGDRVNGVNPDKDYQFKKWRGLQIDEANGLADRRVLDIGANDGFFSLSAIMAGAANVTSIDKDCSTWPGNIQYAARAWGLSPQIITADFRAWESPERYDVIFFLGVLYHLEDPFTAIRVLSSLLSKGGVIYAESQMSQIESPLPLFEYASDIYPTIVNQEKSWLAATGVSNYLFPNLPAVHNLAYSYDFAFEHLNGPQNLFSQEYPFRQLFKFTKM